MCGQPKDADRCRFSSAYYLNGIMECVMKTGVEILKSKGFTDIQISSMDDGQINAIAKTLEKGWKPSGAVVVLETITPKPAEEGKKASKNAGKTGQYLKVHSADNAYNNFTVRVCDGDRLTKEGLETATAFLTSLANNAADLLSKLSK